MAVLSSTKRPTIPGCPKTFYHKSMKISRCPPYFIEQNLKFVNYTQFSTGIFQQKDNIKNHPSEAASEG
jgi:hypothetical protein